MICLRVEEDVFNSNSSRGGDRSESRVGPSPTTMARTSLFEAGGIA
ncbi:hypothetical protein [Candidatus Palauibacter sp.]